MAERIRGKVAQVDDYRVVLNRGAKDGVEVGARFAFLSREKVDIYDPENPDGIIGKFPVARIILKVEAVEENMSIAQTSRTVRYSGFLSGLDLGPSERNDSIRRGEATVAQKLG